VTLEARRLLAGFAGADMVGGIWEGKQQQESGSLEKRLIAENGLYVGISGLVPGDEHPRPTSPFGAYRLERRTRIVKWDCEKT